MHGQVFVMIGGNDVFLSLQTKVTAAQCWGTHKVACCHPNYSYSVNLNLVHDGTPCDSAGKVSYEHKKTYP